MLCNVTSLRSMVRGLEALKGFAGSRSITDYLGKQDCRCGMAPHVCRLRRCIHVYAGLRPVNARRNLMNTTDAEFFFAMFSTIAQDEHSSNQFPVNSGTSRK